jgi:putative acetyltransferase
MTSEFVFPESMKLIRFSSDWQHRVEVFIEQMQKLRGNPFDRENLPPDIQNIQNGYQEYHGDFWILEKTSEIVGCVAFRCIDAEAQIGEIKRYFVAPDYQNQGIGSKLIEHAINFAIKSGFKKIRLDTMKKSKSAIAIFKRNGFYEIPKYNNNPVAEIFMEKELIG